MNEADLSPAGSKRRFVVTGAGGFIGSAVRYIINKEVQQLLIAPTGFPYGIVLVNADSCIGCKLCSWACRYGAREYDQDDG